MKLVLGLLLTLLQAPADDPIPLAAAARAFREAAEAAVADDGKLWGHSLVAPILLADPATRAVVANQPDEQEQLAEREGVFVGTLPPEVGIANTAVEWAGVRWTMVMWPLPENRHARTRLLLHECFHRIQPTLKHAGGDALNAHLDTEAGRTWLRLEFRALAKACVERAGVRKQALEDALVFRAHRRALFPGSKPLEASFERNEGLAEYTGLKLCGLPEWVLADRAAQKLERDETAASFVRSFAYATGPAYGILLDELAVLPLAGARGELGTDWRAGIRERSDLGTMAGEAIAWKTPADLERAATNRAKRYGGEEVVESERVRAAEKARIDARNRARYVDGPVLELALGVKLQYSFDFNAITPLEGAGNVYGVIRIVEVWGILDANAGGALLTLDPNGSPRLARVPAPGDLAARPLAGDGWTLTLEKGWELVPGEREGDWKVVRAQ